MAREATETEVLRKKAGQQELNTSVARTLVENMQALRQTKLMAISESNLYSHLWP
ncbi:hypothetical protein ARMGADRAFT_1006828 [Armillaria gallica]|uniref:Uncharacterized protein n=1 Tax=Armillaria gallica TaxID=47427 RepID=A0A2H3E3F6_ARMGA|nr:hypothetical protein ARMGADRAFT_1006828 [Armillaria gallica]